VQVTSRVGEQVEAIINARDAQGHAEPGGTTSQISINTTQTPRPRHFQSLDNLTGPEKNRAGFAYWLTNHVETVVHSVREIDVGMTRRSEHCGIAVGAPSEGV
jgi:hypothetical protein